METLAEGTLLYVPQLHFFEEQGLTYAVDAEAPNWVVTDPLGSSLLRQLAAGSTVMTFADLKAWYAAERGLDSTKAWLHVHDFLRSLARAGMLSERPFVRDPYPGRSALVEPQGLRELWVQINNACNLCCAHCLVSSGPGQDSGLEASRLIALIDSAVELGLERLYITGGEPLLHKGIFALLRHATEARALETIVLTNATVLGGGIRRSLAQLDRSQVRFQVSIDGARPETNDAVRGSGTFAKTLDGARLLAELGFDVSLTSVTTEHNLDELPRIPAIARSVGAKSYHLMWTHRRGRALTSDNGFFPEAARLIPAVLETIRAADSAGITLDNLEVVKRRVNGVAGVKYDLGNGGWDSLCVSYDGAVYPSAALAGEPPLRCGDAIRDGLRRILETSEVVRSVRAATLARKPGMEEDPLRFFTGGGDWEHAWCFSGGDLHAPDPYYPVAQMLVRHAMITLGREKLARRNLQAGYDAPLVLHAMGEGAIACGNADARLAAQPVLTLHSNCVLSFDVDRPRAKVREYYGAAAEEPKADLCCPISYDPGLTSHIPSAVLDRFYGCGSPVASAAIQQGETVVDLGSGAGIEVFIAAKLVGSGGRVIGIDMTDEMLAVANESRPKVAAALGYDAVEFRKGFLEQLPLESGIADLVTSNCVINLSPDKPRVFEEIWRVLKDHGRFLISDIVSDAPVPPSLKVNAELWGECLVGALTQEEFMAYLERAGFYGLTLLGKSYWKTVEGYAFYSLSVRGYKYEKKAGCIFKGHRAVYLGPAKAFVDDEGHLFARNEPQEVCTDTAAKLSRPPYQGMFAVLEPGDESREWTGCGSAGGRSCCC